MIGSSGDELLARVSFHFELPPHSAAVNVCWVDPLVLLGTYLEWGGWVAGLAYGQL